ncbi:helix-turn-helix domain-containing protein [Pseudonocardia spinosispora]|uniref:AraC-like ligand-binding domain-containing protein n=1 Tax=Pseudonocardia spinosispora TaxID=103441 RepID=UPI00042A921C|nr:helix-turn-helix domain-containing protein [Pseudonocardia spinosispora]
MTPTTSVWDVTDRADGEQFGYWHEVICQAFVPLVPRSAASGPGFAARVETRELHDMVRARIWSQPQETAHGPREVARTDGAFFFVNLQVAGRCRARQGRTESVVRPGQFTVLDTTEPYYLDFDERWRMISFRLPRDLLTARLGGARPALAEPVDGGHGAGGVVGSMMTSLWDVELPAGSAASAELGHAFASAVAAASVGASAFADQPRAVLRAEVLRHVRNRLGDSSLSVASVCARLGIAPRTLHAAFVGGERTFAATVRRLRLERCATLLADPTTPGTITAIAASVGFDDPASFSRAFRREFGCTPSEVRAAPIAQSIGTHGQDSGD